MAKKGTRGDPSVVIIRKTNWRTAERLVIRLVGVGLSLMRDTRGFSLAIHSRSLTFAETLRKLNVICALLWYAPACQHGDTQSLQPRASEIRAEMDERDFARAEALVVNLRASDAAAFTRTIDIYYSIADAAGRARSFVALSEPYQISA